MNNAIFNKFLKFLKYTALIIICLMIPIFGPLFLAYLGFLWYKKQKAKKPKDELQNIIEQKSPELTAKVVYRKKPRDMFFKGNYLKESASDSYGSARELSGIVPLTIVYENNQKEINTRYIEVFAISTADRSAFLLAFCHLKAARRVFSPYGIKSMKDLNGTEYKTREEINAFFLEKVVPLLKNERNKKIVQNCFLY